MEFPGLEPTIVTFESPLNRSQRYLASAYDSVSSLFEVTYPAVRALRSGSRGRLTDAEHDMFRAAIVFTAAGIDTVFKQALRDCVATQLDRSESARDKYLEFVTAFLRVGPAVDPRQLAILLTAKDSEVALKDAYVEQLTGSSLQSVSQVTAALSALGLQEETHLYRDAKELDLLFKARNQIAHELDMTEASVSGRGARYRRERKITATRNMCHGGLNYSQRVLNSLELRVTQDLGL